MTAQDTIALPFFDDFAASKDGRANRKLWAQSSITVSGNFSATQQMLQTAVFDILDENGVIYAAAATGNFAADTLASHALRFPSGSTDVYISFSFMPAGFGDMPEQQDSLLLYFFHPRENNWFLAWSATTNATMGRTCDTITQHFFLPPSQSYSTKSFWKDSMFVTTMVRVPDADAMRFSETGFRFMFVNMASRSGADVAGMRSNADLWLLDYVYLNTNRDPNRTTIVDMAIQRQLVSFLKEYTAMPWSHLRKSATAQREQLLNDTTNRVHLPFYLCNVSPNPNYAQVDMRLRVRMGGTWDTYNTYEGLGSIPNLEGSTTLLVSPQLTLTHSEQLLEAVSADADSAAIEVQYVIRSNYQVEPDIAHLLRNNDTTSYLQKFFGYYAYDDGTAEKGYGLYGENARNAETAIKFHTYCTDTLSGVLIYFNNTIDSENYQPFLLTIRSSTNGAPDRLLFSQQLQSTFVGLNQFVYYKFNQKIVVAEGDFFVGLRQQSTTMLNVGVDVSRTGSGRTYYNLGMQWLPSGIDGVGTLMVRPSFARTDATISTSAPLVPPHISMSAYPNPTFGEINLILPDDIERNNLIVNVLDIMGRVVRTTPFAETIDISGLAAGVYFLQVNNSGTIAMQKIVVAK